MNVYEHRHGHRRQFTVKRLLFFAEASEHQTIIKLFELINVKVLQVCFEDDSSYYHARR